MEINKYLVFQLTSRRNYDVAEILSKQGKLKYLITDFYCKKSFFDKVICFFIISFKKFKNPSINDNVVFRNILSGLIFRFIIKFFSKKHFNKGLIISSKILLKGSIKKLESNSFKSVYAFDTGAYEIFKKFSSCKKLILEQCVAPRITQIKMYKVLSQKYNLDFKPYLLNCNSLLEIEKNELALASQIICPSLYVKNELINTGVNNKKIRVIPYGFNNPFREGIIIDNIKNKVKQNKFHILFVGNEAVRKGALDILEVAKELVDENEIFFHFVGEISEELNLFNINNFTSNIIMHGKLEKEELFEIYLKSSLFFLPSYLEGSALVNYEALSFGVPLLTTFESGSVISHQQQGYITNPGDTSEMKKHIMSLFNDKRLQLQLSTNAFNLSKNYTLKQYKERLNKVI